MRLGLIGFGAIAGGLAELLGRDAAPAVARLTTLVRPGALNATRARLAEILPGRSAAVADLEDLLAVRPDLVVECAGHGAAATLVPPILRAGIDVVLVSVGALADPDLEATLRGAAAEGGARLILPSGAVGGIDLLAALGQEGGLEVRYRGTKPPAAWKGSPAEAALDLDALTAPATFFSGSARQAAAAYPKNANVAATIALAGAGLDATEVELVADPAAPGNVHEYHVAAPSARFSIRIENRPSAGNARTSAATILSVLREIANRAGPVAI